MVGSASQLRSWHERTRGDLAGGADLIPARRVPVTDRLTIRMVVGILGSVAILGVILMGLLAYQEKPTPDALIGVTSGAIAAVAALLSRTGSDPPPE